MWQCVVRLSRFLGRIVVLSGTGRQSPVPLVHGLVGAHTETILKACVVDEWRCERRSFVLAAPRTLPDSVCGFYHAGSFPKALNHHPPEKCRQAQNNKSLLTASCSFANPCKKSALPEIGAPLIHLHVLQNNSYWHSHTEIPDSWRPPLGWLSKLWSLFGYPKY